MSKCNNKMQIPDVLSTNETVIALIKKKYQLNLYVRPKTLFFSKSINVVAVVQQVNCELVVMNFKLIYVF